MHLLWVSRCRLGTQRFWFVVTLFILAATHAAALDGTLTVHDPSTVAVCDGSYYVFSTGGGIPILTSSDGFTWKRSGKVFDHIPDSVHAYVPKNSGTSVWAPDIIKLNGSYYLYYSISKWGQYVSAVGLLTNQTLDPLSPKYKWIDHGMVVHSVDGEELNAIDPGVFQAPDGTLWICYGSYHGSIQLAQLDPVTGLRIAPNSHVWEIARQSEASDIIYHAGYYYLFVNHGSCCQGHSSTYNIRVGRSRQVTGPYFDRHGEDMAQAGGTLFLAAQGSQIGPGHFGRLVEDGVEKFSCHYEADLNLGGKPTLDIRPLLWTTDGWPLPGQNIKDGTYQIRSLQTEMNMQTPPATAADNGTVRLDRYIVQDNQKWLISPSGGGYYKIINSASGKALAIPELSIQEAVPAASVHLEAFTGADSQRWKIDQASDSSYIFAAKSSRLVLTAGARGTLTLQAYSGNDTQRWMVNAP